MFTGQIGGPFSQLGNIVLAFRQAAGIAAAGHGGLRAGGRHLLVRYMALAEEEYVYRRRRKSLPWKSILDAKEHEIAVKEKRQTEASIYSVLLAEV